MACVTLLLICPPGHKGVIFRYQSEASQEPGRAMGWQAVENVRRADPGARRAVGWQVVMGRQAVEARALALLYKDYLSPADIN